MEAIRKQKVYPFLQDGGEMGELTRNFDWSRTVIGSPDNWPQSLRTTVSNLLHSQFPMFLWWGPSMIQFYNDAYRPSLGNEGKHPTALGQNGEECWPEIWPIIFPLIQQVRNTGKPTWKEDQLVPIYRNGKIEDVYWTYSYSSVLDDDGKHAGILVTCVETTEKVNNLKQLAESEDQLRFAIEATELGTWDYNPLTNKLTGNQRLKEWFGIPPGQGVDLSLAMAVLSEKDRERVADAIKTCLQYESGGYYDIEYTIIQPGTGRERIVRAKGRAWFNDEKIAYRFNGTLQDVTDQVLSRKKIAEADERARLSIEAAELGTFEINMVTGLVITSERFDAIFDLDHSESNKDYIKHIHPEDLSVREEAYKRAFETGALIYEARIIWKDGSIHWIKAQGKVYFNELHQPVKLLGVVQDITEEKAFSQELERQVKNRTEELTETQLSLLNANNYLQTIINLCKEPVQVLEPVFSGEEIIDFRFKLTNNAYAAYANTTPAHLQNRLVGEVFPGYFETSSFINVVKVFKTNVSDSWEIHYDKDGLDLYNQMSATRIGNEIVVYFTDFTKLKHLQLELMRKIKELERSNQNLEEFAYAASHDLKEPIRKINFFSDRLKTSLNDTLQEQEKHSFERMQVAAKRMGMLVDDLLSYSKVSTEEILLDEINLRSLIDQVLNDLDLEIEQKGATVEIDGEFPVISGHYRQLQQVFQNVFTNSLKYANADIPLVIHISCRKIFGKDISASWHHNDYNKAYHEVSIRDNGIGFDKKDSERIFNVFTRLHGNAQYKGTGVGLSIARKVMENHKGFIVADGEVNKGAIFRVLFPA